MTLFDKHLIQIYKESNLKESETYISDFYKESNQTDEWNALSETEKLNSLDSDFKKYFNGESTVT